MQGQRAGKKRIILVVGFVAASVGLVAAQRTGTALAPRAPQESAAAARPLRSDPEAANQLVELRQKIRVGLLHAAAAARAEQEASARAAEPPADAVVLTVAPVPAAEATKLRAAAELTLSGKRQPAAEAPVDDTRRLLGEIENVKDPQRRFSLLSEYVDNAGQLDASPQAAALGDLAELMAESAPSPTTAP